MSHPGLLTGCYAFALFDTWQWTVFCWPHLLIRYELQVSWNICPLVIHPSFAWQQGLLTFILSLARQLALLVLSSLGFSSTTGFRPSRWDHPCRVESAFGHTLSIETKFLSEPIVQDPSRWGHRFGSSLCTLYILDRNEGFSWLLFPSFFRMESPF